MNIQISIHPPHRSRPEFANVKLICKEAKRKTRLDLEFAPIAGVCGMLSHNVLDFLFLACLVYTIDKLVPRELAMDRWTRSFEMSVPVASPTTWNQLSGKLETCLSFLTGDQWHLHFSKRRKPLTYVENDEYEIDEGLTRQRFKAVSLFSGGLDSLIGVIDWLESNRRGKLLLVGHHDRNVPGPLSDQKRLFKHLTRKYRHRISLMPVCVGQVPAGDEITFRSRSLVFIALGMCAAHSLESNTPLLVPENGTIALNVPLTASRRGSCSTRTAHPFFLNSLREILSELGIENPILNPLGFKTKGESVEQCLNQDILRETAPLSVSCAKRGHKSSWKNHHARECGRCMPCIYRRAALHKVGLDTEQYGTDICKGDVDLDSSAESTVDFRACFSFAQGKLTQKQIMLRLLSAGHLDVQLLPQYADIVNRSMKEIRKLLQSKGSRQVRERLRS